jgi:membrane protein
MFKGIWQSFYKALIDTINHDGVEHAGYLSFLLMLSIFPFLVFFVALIGLVGNKGLADLLVEMIINSSWANFIDALKPRILEITSSPPQSLLTLAIVSAIWTASSIFEGLRTILNRAYRVKNAPAYLLRRLLSIFEFATVTVVIVIFLVILIVLPVLFHLLESYHFYNSEVAGWLGPESQALRAILGLAFTFFMITGLYYFLPNRKQKLKNTMPGALMVFLGWYLSSYLFKMYLANFHQVNIIYGSIAGIIIALLYFYVCSLVFIFGAEFNYHLENRNKINLGRK